MTGSSRDVTAAHDKQAQQGPTGLAGAGVKNWEFTAPLKLDSGAIGLIWSVPPQNPKTFKPTEYALNTLISQQLPVPLKLARLKGRA